MANKGAAHHKQFKKYVKFTRAGKGNEVQICDIGLQGSSIVLRNCVKGKKWNTQRVKKASAEEALQDFLKKKENRLEKGYELIFEYPKPRAVDRALKDLHRDLNASLPDLSGVKGGFMSARPAKPSANGHPKQKENIALVPGARFQFGQHRPPLSPAFAPAAIDPHMLPPSYEQAESTESDGDSNSMSRQSDSRSTASSRHGAKRKKKRTPQHHKRKKVSDSSSRIGRRRRKASIRSDRSDLSITPPPALINGFGRRSRSRGEKVKKAAAKDKAGAGKVNDDGRRKYAKGNKAKRSASVHSSDSEHSGEEEDDEEEEEEETDHEDEDAVETGDETDDRSRDGYDSEESDGGRDSDDDYEMDYEKMSEIMYRTRRQPMPEKLDWKPLLKWVRFDESLDTGAEYAFAPMPTRIAGSCHELLVVYLKPSKGPIVTRLLKLARDPDEDNLHHFTTERKVSQYLSRIAHTVNRCWRQRAQVCVWPVETVYFEYKGQRKWATVQPPFLPEPETNAIFVKIEPNSGNPCVNDPCVSRYQHAFAAITRGFDLVRDWQGFGVSHELFLKQCLFETVPEAEAQVRRREGRLAAASKVLVMIDPVLTTVGAHYENNNPTDFGMKAIDEWRRNHDCEACRCEYLNLRPAMLFGLGDPDMRFFDDRTPEAVKRAVDACRRELGVWTGDDEKLDFEPDA